jgi:trehalose-6-phosphate synthase
MSGAEQSKRMRLLRANVASFDSRWWARQLLDGAMAVNRADRELIPRPSFPDPTTSGFVA